MNQHDEELPHSPSSDRLSEVAEVEALHHQKRVPAIPASGFEKIDKLKKRRRQVQDQAQQDYDTKLRDLSERLEDQIIRYSDKVRETVEGADKHIEATLELLKNDATLVKMGFDFFPEMWEQLLLCCNERTQGLKAFGDELEQIEMERTNVVEKQLKVLASRLLWESAMPYTEVQRIIQGEAHELNLVLISNRRSHAELLARLYVKDVRVLAATRRVWEMQEAHWKALRHDDAIRRFQDTLNSNAFVDPSKRRNIIQALTESQQQRHENSRLQLIRQLCGLKPPALTSEIVTSIRQQLEILRDAEDQANRDAFLRFEQCNREIVADMEQLRESLRYDLHTFGALMKEPELLTVQNKYAGYLEREDLEEFFRKSGGLKPELKYIHDALSSPRLIYSAETQLIIDRVALLAASLDLDTTLEKQGKAALRKAALDALEKIRTCHRDDMIGVAQGLTGPLNALLAVSVLNPLLKKELDEVAQEFRNLSLQGRAQTASGASVATSHNLGLENTISTADLSRIRNIQRRLGIALCATDISAEAQQMIAETLEMLQQQLKTNDIIDRVVEDASSSLIQQRTTEATELLKEVGKALDLQSTNLHFAAEKLTNFFKDMAALLETHNRQVIETEEMSKDNLWDLSKASEQKLDELERELKERLMELRQAQDEISLESLFKQCLGMLDRIESEYRRYYGEATTEAVIHLKKVEEQEEFHTQQICERFRVIRLSKETGSGGTSKHVTSGEVDMGQEAGEGMHPKAAKYKPSKGDKTARPATPPPTSPRFTTKAGTNYKEIQSPSAFVASLLSPSVNETEDASSTPVETCIERSVTSPRQQPNQSSAESNPTEAQATNKESSATPAEERAPKAAEFEPRPGTAVRGEQLALSGRIQLEVSLTDQPATSSERFLEENKAKFEEADKVSRSVFVIPSTSTGHPCFALLSFDQQELSNSMHDLRDDVFEKMEDFSTDRIRVAKALHQKRGEILATELEERLRQHWPRRGRTDVKFYQPRQNELIVHRQRSSRQVKAMLKKNTAHQETFQTLVEENRKFVDEYHASQVAFLAMLPMQANLAALQGLEKKVKVARTAFIQGKEEKVAAMAVLANQEPEALLKAGEDFILACENQIFQSLDIPASGAATGSATAPDGEILTTGEYNCQEIQLVRKSIDQANNAITSSRTERLKEIENFKLAAEEALSCFDTFTERYQTEMQSLSMREGLGRKYGAPRRRAQERIRTEMTRCDFQLEKIEDLIKQIEKLCHPSSYTDTREATSVSPSSSAAQLESNQKKPKRHMSQQICILVIQLRRNIFQLAVYLQFLKWQPLPSAQNPQAAQAPPPQQLQRSGQTSTNASNSQANMQGPATATLFVQFVPRVGAVEGVDTAGYEELEDLMAGMRQGEALKSFQVSIQNIVEICKTETKELFAQEGKTDELSSPSGIPPSLESYLLEQEASARSFAESCQRRLRESVENFQEIAASVGPAVIQDIFQRYCKQVTSNQKILETEFQQTMGSLEARRVDHERALKPQLANPRAKQQLDKLVKSEQDRSKACLEAIDSTVSKTRSNECNAFRLFDSTMLESVRTVLKLLDSLIVPSDLKALPGDETMELKRKNLKRLRKLSRRHGSVTNNTANANASSNPVNGAKVAQTTSTGGKTNSAPPVSSQGDEDDEDLSAQASSSGAGRVKLPTYREATRQWPKIPAIDRYRSQLAPLVSAGGQSAGGQRPVTSTSGGSQNSSSAAKAFGDEAGGACLSFVSTSHRAVIQARDQFYVQYADDAVARLAVSESSLAAFRERATAWDEKWRHLVETLVAADFAGV